MKENKSTIIIIVLVFIIFITYSFGIYKAIKAQPINDNLIIYDTVYNTIVLDSIKYNIKYKDTIIYNYKQELKYEIEKAKTVSDTDAVKLFYQLLSEY